MKKLQSKETLFKYILIGMVLITLSFNLFAVTNLCRVVSELSENYKIEVVKR